MEKFKVAIIVPVYNVEKYIKECLISIKEQTYKNFVAIVVNDGSQDNSVSIIEDTIKDDDRFIFLKKKNEGVSITRNIALQYIKDNNLDIDYLAYVDSDDLITKDFVEIFVNKMSENNADVAFCFYKELYKSKTVVISEDIEGKDLVCNKDKIISFYVQDENLPNEYRVAEAIFLCNKVFNYQKVKHISFNEKKGIIGEDINYLLDVLSIINKAIVIPKNLYIYRLRQGSLSHTKEYSRGINTIEMFIDNLTKYEHPKINYFIHKELLVFFYNVFSSYVILNKKEEAQDFWNRYISIIKKLELEKATKKEKKKIFLSKLGFSFNYLYHRVKAKTHDYSNHTVYDDYFD